MSTQPNTNLAQQAYESFKAGNIPALLDLLSDNIEWELPVVADIPYTGKRQGREAVGQFFAMVDESQEALLFEPQQFIEQGDKIVGLGRYAWRVKATGREYASDFAHVFTVRGGKIVGFHEYLDTAVAAAAHQKAPSA